MQAVLVCLWPTLAACYDKQRTTDGATTQILRRELMRRNTNQLACLIMAFSLLAMWGCQGQQVRDVSSVSSIAGTPADEDFFGPVTTAQPDGFLGPQSTRARGEQRVLVVAVRFSDVKPKFALSKIRQRAVSDLDDYVRAQSYGQTWVKADFKGWVDLGNPVSAYRISPNNFEVDRSRVRKLIEDTMTALEGEVRFSQYNNMLIIPGVITTPGKGYGMMCYCANPGMLTGVRGNPRFVTLRSRGGQQFSEGVFVGTENAPLGMFAHDFFHALGGVYGNMRLAP